MRTFIPPKAVARAAERGLELRRSLPKSKRCCTKVGIRRAVQLSNRQPVSVDTLERMVSYFERHEVDKRGLGWGDDSKGYQAWLMWGGDVGWSWAERTLASYRTYRRNSTVSVLVDDLWRGESAWSGAALPDSPWDSGLTPGDLVNELSDEELVDLGVDLEQAEYDFGSFAYWARIYASNGSAGTPPVSAQLVDGTWVVEDGFHRIAAAKAVGLRRLPVEVLS